jgi:hypothetical protein
MDLKKRMLNWREDLENGGRFVLRERGFSADLYGEKGAFFPWMLTGPSCVGLAFRRPHGLYT